MLWLIVLWVGLIAVWGASDDWTLGGARRWVAHTVHAIAHHDGADPRP